MGRGGAGPEGRAPRGREGRGGAGVHPLKTPAKGSSTPTASEGRECKPVPPLQNPSGLVSLKDQIQSYN